MKHYTPRPKSAASKMRNRRLRARKQLKMTQDVERHSRYAKWNLPGEEEMI